MCCSESKRLETFYKDEPKYAEKMKKKPLKLQPLNSELSQSEEAGRRISESLMSRVATAGTMKGL